MDFEVQHQFDATIDAVISAMVNPAFYDTFTIPDVGPFTTAGPDTAGTFQTLHVRYEYVGSLDPIVKRVIAGGDIVLLQDVGIDTAARRGRLDVSTEHHRGILTCAGAFTFDEAHGRTSRTLTGELKVRVPLLGGKAERSLLPGILERLRAEAEALNAYLKAQPNG